MTKRRAERLTGYDVRELPPEQGLCAVGAFEGDKLVMKGVGRADFIALRLLVHSVLLIHGRKAMEHHGWRCTRCRSSGRLEVHHRKYRSHGGTHQVENLEPVCRDCHNSFISANGRNEMSVEFERFSVYVGLFDT